MRKKRILCWILLAVLLLTAGCHGGGSPSDTGIEPPEQTEEMPPQEILNLFSKGKTDYVIVCNFSDSKGKDFAVSLASLLQEKTGCYVGVKSHSSGYAHELMVGEVDREALLSVKARMNPEGDCAVLAEGDGLVFYATDERQYQKLYFYLRDVLWKDLPEGNLVFSPSDNFVSSLRPDLELCGSVVTLCENGIGKYKIIYSPTDGNSISQAAFLKQYLLDTLQVSFPIAADTETAEHEIILTGANRRQEKEVSGRLEKKDDFGVCLLGDDVVLTGTDPEMQVLAMVRFADLCRQQTEKGKIVMKESENYIYSKDGRAYEYDAEDYCRQYQKLYSTYSSYHEDKLFNKSWLPESARLDQKLIGCLIERMGTGFSVEIGSSSVLTGGFVRKLDPSDYTKSAKREGGDIFIPRAFAETFFKEELKSVNGYVNLSEFCRTSADYTLFYQEQTGLAVLTPKGVASFETPDASDGNYTNAAYLERMHGFFHSAIIPEPENNTEQSRAVIEFAEYPRFVPDFHTNEYITTYSPSIEILQEGGRTVYYVAYELCLVRDFAELSVDTVIKKSLDGGTTWETVVEKIPGLRWASVFSNRGTVYLLGSNLFTGNAEIVEVGEDGSYRRAILFSAGELGGGTAPGTVLHAGGRIYKAYHGSTISAEETANLMNPAAWTVSNTTKSEELAPNGGEGSMVQGKDGEIYQVMHTDRPGSAYVLRLSKDGKTYTPTNPDTGNEVVFPTCISKSSVIYDEKSGKYLSLSNICNTQNKRQRNVLALVYSEDLVNWKIADYVLVEREMINPLYSTTAHAFQYADFKIDGEDMVMVIREAAGYTNTYHDGNYTTFYRFENFRSCLGQER